MRIVAGKFKSRRLSYPKSKTIRPTMDRVKEALFNVLGNDLTDMRVLDLYAGSGALGLEALSRGAASVVFVDSASPAIRAIKQNIEELDVAENVEVIKMRVFEVLDIFNRNKREFDLILIDPPYNTDLTKKTLMKIYGFDILARNGKLVIEHSAHDQLPCAKHIEIVTHKKFGETHLSFLINRA
jgi:16S rRNA (guanine(966)-N(2))-methyltransferase RsmD